MWLMSVAPNAQRETMSGMKGDTLTVYSLQRRACSNSRNNLRNSETDSVGYTLAVRSSQAIEH